MPEPIPPPLPTPPTAPGRIAPPQKVESGMEGYHKVAETVGFLPSLRGKDNLYQVIAVALGVVLGLIGGFATYSMSQPAGAPMWIYLGIGGVLGLIVATFLSGLVLMVIGWIRAMKRK